MPDDVIVELHAAAVNPSDVKAAIGMMPYAIFPRTPGRDYAGVVVDGPADLVGKAVFGSSGDLGIRRDGTHATHLVVEKDALVMKPDNISIYEAAGIGVPFVTAIEGFRRAGMPKPGETVLVMGVNGKVGQAAAQIAAWQGARVIGVVRKSEPYAGFASCAGRDRRQVEGRCRHAGARDDRRQGRRHRLQHGRRPLLPGRA